MTRETRFRFESGLEFDDVRALANLIGLDPGPHPSGPDLPFISTVLLFRKIGADQRLRGHVLETGLVLIQENLSIEVKHPLVPDRTMIVDAHVAEKSGGKIQVEAETSDGDGVHLARTQALVRSVTARQIGGLRNVPLLRVTRGVELPTFHTAPVTREVVERYLSLTGDSNPVHTDPDYAGQAGLLSPVLPGTLVAGFAQPAIAELFPPARLLDLRVRFTATIPVGECVAISIQERRPVSSETPGDLRLFFHWRSGVLAIADARVVSSRSETGSSDLI